MSQRGVHGKRRRGRHKSNSTPHSGNIANWIDGNVEEITRNSLDRAIDGDNWYDAVNSEIIPPGLVLHVGYGVVHPPEIRR